MTTRAETIANHVNAAGEHLKAAVCVGNTKAASVDRAIGCLRLAFLECLGGAECASPALAAEGPWVVRGQIHARGVAAALRAVLAALRGAP